MYSNYNVYAFNKPYKTVFYVLLRKSTGRSCLRVWRGRGRGRGQQLPLSAKWLK